MSLTPYLGDGIIKDIQAIAVERSKDFLSQNAATKAAMANDIKIELEMYREGVEHVLNIVDDAAATIEHQDETIDYYKTTFGEVDKKFVEQGKLNVIRTADRVHAKRMFYKYIEDYNKNKNSNNGNASINQVNKAAVPAKIALTRRD